jgi:hypothetical protein
MQISRFLAIAASLVTSLLALPHFTVAETSGASGDRLEKEFASPGPEFRGKPFWSWNGELEESELKRQIGVLQGMGMGGGFMHSRTGLATEYLGDEWFRLINSCADALEKVNLEAWLYDEDRWPSGTAGGRVTENPKYRARFMSLATVPAAGFHWKDDLVAAFATDLKGDSYTQCVRLTRDTPAASYAGKTVLAFRVEEMSPGSFYNGFTYADTLNREATDCFIRLTHEQYKARCGDRLGRSIKGIFTDEPYRGPVFNGFGISNANRLQMCPWTGDLPSQFQKRYGYDLVERLPELFFRKDGQAVAKVKWQYVDLLQSMFLENWARPIHDWCKANRMIFTGHVLHEDSLTCQTAPQGSLMRFYECQDWPGVDVLSEGNRNYWIVKQVASVARQLGQKRILSETYGCTGWQFNFESHKYVGDWQALLGVNLRCPHLSWYTMAGEAKRDYPASIFYQSAWWKDYRFVEDYYSRLNVMLAQGSPACDVLVVNPVESVWCQVGVGWADGLSPRTRAIQELESAYAEVFHWLMRSHIDFDYGDEEMLGRLSKVERDGAGAVLRVGKAPYRVVVLPKMTTIRSTTLKLLDEFRRAGGKVVVLGEPPAFVDAEKSPSACDLASKAVRIAWSCDALVGACKDSLRVPVEIVDAAGKPLGDVFCQVREDADRTVLVAMNMDRSQGRQGARLRVRAAGQVVEWDCVLGKRFAIPAETKDGWTEWTADFAPVGEHVFVLSRRAESKLPVKVAVREVSRLPATGPFEYRLSEPNVCVFDMARYRINDGPWQPETEVLKIDRAVRRSFNLPIRGGEMVQPWFSKKFGAKAEPKGAVAMAFEFTVETLPQQPMMLGIEQPENFRIKLNGHAVAAEARGWWVDPAIKTIAIPADMLVQGANKLELTTSFRQDMDIEALYLLGRFGVRLEGTRKTLARLPERLAPSDVVAQGLPFYSGAITYLVPISAKAGGKQGLMVETPRFEAACIKVNPGQEPSGLIAWQPYRAEIRGDAAARGVVELEVVLTRRNTFGPLHLVPMRSGAYGPGHWMTEGAGWSQKYQLYPAGLLTSPVISVTESR